MLEGICWNDSEMVKIILTCSACFGHTRNFTRACLLSPASWYAKLTSKLDRPLCSSHPLAPHTNCPLPLTSSAWMRQRSPILPSCIHATVAHQQQHHDDHAWSGLPSSGLPLPKSRCRVWKAQRRKFTQSKGLMQPTQHSILVKALCCWHQVLLLLTEYHWHSLFMAVAKPTLDWIKS